MVIAWHRLSTTEEDGWDELDDVELLDKYELVVKSGALLSAAERGEQTDIEEIDIVTGDHHNIYLKLGSLHRAGPTGVYFPEDVGDRGDITALCEGPPLAREYCFNEWRRVYAFGFDLKELLDLDAFVGPDLIEHYIAVLVNEPWYYKEWPKKLSKKLSDKIKRVQKQNRLYGKKALIKMKALAIACRENLKKGKLYSTPCLELFDQNEVGIADELPLNLARFVIAAGILYKRPY